VLTLTLIDGVESLATIAAIDRIDPFRRKSDPNRTLFAMGVSNMCSSMAGGLTIIPGGVKSTACIVGGGRTQWANFYNALFLILYIVIGRDVINLMPLSALGAIVIYTGYKLCAPKVWKHIAHIGGEQLFVFTATVLATLTTDLLWGIATGMLVKLALEIWISSRVERTESHAPVGRRLLCCATQTGELFRNPVVQSLERPDGYHLYFARPLVCFNSLYLNDALARIPSGSTAVYLHITDLVTMIDHTTSTVLQEFVEDFKRSGRGIVEILGLERLRAQSQASTCMRVSRPVLAQERAQALQAMTRLSLSGAGAQSLELTHSLAHLSLSSLDPSIVDAPDHPVTEYLTRVGSSLFVKVRRTLVLAQAAYGSINATQGADTQRDLNWFSLSRPAGVDTRPVGELAYRSLTEPKSQARARATSEREGISWI
jgi:MFS superfamily sulfate permease-like transporter